MLYCPKCGNELIENSSFCNKCGSSLKDFTKAKDSSMDEDNAKVDYSLNNAKSYSTSSFYRVEDESTEQESAFDEVYQAKKESIGADEIKATEAPPVFKQPEPQPQRQIPTAPPAQAAPQPQRQVPIAQPVVQASPQPVRPSVQSDATLPIRPTAQPDTTMLMTEKAISPQASVAVTSDFGDTGGGAKAKANPNTKLMMILLAIVSVVLIIGIVIFVLASGKKEPVQFAKHTDGTSATEKDVPVKEEVKEVEPAKEEPAVTPNFTTEENLVEEPPKDINDSSLVTTSVYNYYASYIDTLNLQDTSNLLNSTDANLKIVKEKMEGPNKGFSFVALSATFDMDSVSFYEEDGKNYCKLNAEFEYSFRKADSEDRWDNAKNKQRYTLVYDKELDNWLIDSGEIDSSITISENHSALTYQ